MSRQPNDDLPTIAQLSRKIIGLAMRVHTALGCGFGESIYREAMAIELREAGIVFEIHPTLPVFYKGQQAGTFQADLIIDSRLIVELKAVEFLAVAHSVQLVGYLAAAGIENGLLLNFGAKACNSKRRLEANSLKTNPQTLQLFTDNLPRKKFC